MFIVYRTLILLLLIVPATAQAGSIVFTITGTGINASKTYTLSDADINRIIATNQIAANAANNAPASKMFVLNYWIQQFINSTIQSVQSFEKQTAVDAVPTPSPINPQ